MRAHRTAIPTATSLMLRGNSEGRLVHLGDAAERLLGVSAEAWLGQNTRDLLDHCGLTRVANGDVSELDEAMAIGTFRGSEGKPVEVRVEYAGGGDAPVRTEGTVTRLAPEICDGALDAIAALDEMLACPDLDCVFGLVVEMACSQLGVERCAIYRVRGDDILGTVGTDISGRPVDESNRVLSAEDGLVASLRLPEESEGQWRVSTGELTWWDGEKAVPVGHGWTACTPIRADGRTWGWLCNDTAISGAPMLPRQQEALAQLASLLSRVLERGTLDEALGLARLSLENASVAVYRISSDGRIEYVNEEACTALGYTREELTSMSIWDLDPDFTRDAWLEHWERQREQGKITFETRHKTKDGRTFPVQVTRNPIEFKGAEYSFAFSIDITERNARTQALRDHAALQTVLAEVHALPAEASEDELLHVFVSAVVSSYELKAGVFRRCGDSGTGIVFSVGTTPDCCPHERCGEDGACPAKCAVMLPLTVDGVTEGRFAAFPEAPDDLSAERVERLNVLLAEMGAVIHSRRIRKQEALDRRSLEDRYRALFEAARDAMFVADVQTGIILDANAEAEALMHMSRDELIGLHQSELHPPDVAHYREVFREHGCGQGGKLQEGEVLTASGERVPVEITGNAIQLADGNDVVLGVFRDLTERRQIESASRLASLGELAAGVAHEFNNILSVLQARSEIAAVSESSEDYEKLASSVARGVARGAEICRNLTEFARPAEPSREAISLEEPIEAAVTMAFREIAGPGIEVERHYEPDAGLVYVDHGQLEQVFLNLIINACHAMPDGGRLILSVKHEPGASGPGHTVALVTDTGSGIPQDALSRVFEPFFTTKGRLGDSDVPGTGLGLSVSHAIVRTHGGALDVSSKLGVGSTFSVRLPTHVERPGLAERSAEKQGDVSPVQTEGIDGPPSLGTARILLAEDEKELRELVTDVLRGEGYDVMSVASGAQAEQALHEDTFDVVLTDLHMPEGGGLRVLDTVSRMDGEVGVVVITGRVDADIYDEVLEAGAKVCLQKPFSIRGVLDAVTIALGR